MKPADLLDQLEAYYGPWPTCPMRPSAAGIIPTEILKYIDEEINPSRLELLYKAILRSHSTRDGAPDVAAVELAVYRAAVNGTILRRAIRGGDRSSGEPVQAEELKPPTVEDLALVEEAKSRLAKTELGKRLLADLRHGGPGRSSDLLGNWGPVPQKESSNG